MLQTCFLTKNAFFCQISERSKRTCIIRIWIQEVKIYLKMTKIFSTYIQTTRWWNSSRLLHDKPSLLRISDFVRKNVLIEL